MDIQKEMFRNLLQIKDYWVSESVKSIACDSDLLWSDFEHEYKLLHSKLVLEEDIRSYEKVVGELVKGVIHSILVMIDGGDSLADIFKLDLIDQETKESLKDGIALHEEFMGYLIDVEG